MQIVAEALVLHGDSRQKLVPFVADSPRRITLGSDPSCEWCVRGEDVGSRHAEMLWDGGQLVLFDTWGLGLRANGQQVAGIWRLQGRTLVELGRAVVVVDLRTLAAEFISNDLPVSVVPPSNQLIPTAVEPSGRNWRLYLGLSALLVVLAGVLGLVAT